MRLTKVVSMRLADQQMERLQRFARHLGRTASETSALLVEEALRQAEFEGIDFHDSPVGRQAYVKGSTLAVWEVVQVAESYGRDTQKTAEHLQWPLVQVQAALHYAQTFPEEIRLALEDSRAMDFMTLTRLLPQAEAFTVPREPAPGHTPQPLS